MRRFFTEFCNNRNIHGVRYFTSRMLHWSERSNMHPISPHFKFTLYLPLYFLLQRCMLYFYRLWWIITFGLSLWLCGSMMQDVWEEWNVRPTKFDLAEMTHISRIPFPTITICPEIKTMRQKFDLSSKFDKNQKLVANLSNLE